MSRYTLCTLITRHLPTHLSECRLANGAQMPHSGLFCWLPRSPLNTSTRLTHVLYTSDAFELQPCSVARRACQSLRSCILCTEVRDAEMNQAAPMSPILATIILHGNETVSETYVTMKDGVWLHIMQITQTRQ